MRFNDIKLLLLIVISLIFVPLIAVSLDVISLAYWIPLRFHSDIGKCYRLNRSLDVIGKHTRLSIWENYDSSGKPFPMVSGETAAPEVSKPAMSECPESSRREQSDHCTRVSKDMLLKVVEAGFSWSIKGAGCERYAEILYPNGQRSLDAKGVWITYGCNWATKTVESELGGIPKALRVIEKVPCPGLSPEKGSGL